MNHRELGATGLSVSAVGMGCNRLGETVAAEAEWVDLVRRAADLEVNLFDTSAQYTKGRSEEILGQALAHREDVYIATKYGSRETATGRDWSSAVMFDAVEGSLQRLQRDSIDVLQIHSPARADLESCDWAEGMARLQDQGKIRHAAVAIREPEDGIWLIENDLAEVLQVTYNMFDTTVEDHLLPLAQEKGVGILARMPLARGVLSGKFKAGKVIPEENRAARDGERALQRLEHIRALRHISDTYPGGIARLALHFSLSHPAVSCIIPGARSIEQLEQNVTAGDGSGLSVALRAEIDEIRATWN